MRVRLTNPERANLLTLILYRFFSERAGRASVKPGRRIEGSVSIETGGMASEITFAEGEILLNNRGGRTSSSVKGEMGAFLKLMKGGALSGVLTGRIRFSGNLLLLLSFYLLVRKLK
ncbi:MAG: hypothetical protein FJ088_08450 [Deltaproteobacteria bacterium]|nr:hypothetical protein [Deltaproteobacteria bacterium]